MTERDLTRSVSSQTMSLAAVALWLGVTLALATWWLIYGLRQITTLSTLEPQLSQTFAAQSRMILSEGLTFIALLLLGGSGLFWLLRREFRRNEQMKLFFATFTHELKTPLASLRLQAEALQEDIEVENPLVSRLLQDASRLELQLDNALFLATARGPDQIHLEPVTLRSLVERVQGAFPHFRFEFEDPKAMEYRVQADRRAIESVLKNLVQNAIVHGQAKRISIAAQKSDGSVSLRFQDDGTGFSGDATSIGKLFYRHTSRSGSGVGLHLSQFLVERMGGRFLPENAESSASADRKGFAVVIQLKEGKAS